MNKSIILTSLIFLGMLLAIPVFADSSLVRTKDDPAVYYLDGDNGQIIDVLGETKCRL